MATSQPATADPTAPVTRAELEASLAKQKASFMEAIHLMLQEQPQTCRQCKQNIQKPSVSNVWPPKDRKSYRSQATQVAPDEDSRKYLHLDRQCYLQTAPPLVVDKLTSDFLNLSIRAPAEVGTIEDRLAVLSATQPHEFNNMDTSGSGPTSSAPSLPRARGSASVLSGQSPALSHVTSPAVYSVPSPVASSASPPLNSCVAEPNNERPYKQVFSEALLATLSISLPPESLTSSTNSTPNCRTWSTHSPLGFSPASSAVSFPPSIPLLQPTVEEQISHHVDQEMAEVDSAPHEEQSNTLSTGMYGVIVTHPQEPDVKTEAQNDILSKVAVTSATLFQFSNATQAATGTDMSDADSADRPTSSNNNMDSLGAAPAAIYFTSIPSSGIRNGAEHRGTSPTSPTDGRLRTTHKRRNAFRIVIKEAVVNMTNLGKRENSGLSWPSYKSPRQSNFSAPESFFLSFPTFRPQLNKELVVLVKKLDDLVLLQPWFAAFRMSNQHTGAWVTALATKIEQLHFPSYESGADQGFQKAYHELMKWYARCEAVPVVSKFGQWLKDYALPALIEHFSKSLMPWSVAGCPLTLNERKVSLTKIFTVIARANLRLVMLRAQGSFVRLQLTSDGSRTLPEGSPVVGWDVLQNMALETERLRAAQFKNKPLDATLRAKYEEFIDSAVSLYHEKYGSLGRNIAKINKETGQSEWKKHPRWASTDAYLKDANNSYKLVEDDGVKLLVFKIRQVVSLSATLEKVEPIWRDTKKSIPAARRLYILHDLFVRFRYAYVEWRATHGKSILAGMPDPDKALQGFVRAFEWKIVEYVDAHPAHRDLATKQYMDKANITIEALIDDPLEVLKDTVRDHYKEAVSLAMNTRDFTRGPVRGTPAMIPKEWIWTGPAELLKPLPKRSCCNDVREAEPKRPEFDFGYGRSGCMQVLHENADAEMK